MSANPNWDQSATPLRHIIPFWTLAGPTTNHICPLALIWLSSPKGIHIIRPSPSHPSVLHPSFVAIHNNCMKMLTQGFSRIIPDFKQERYPSWQRVRYVLFSYWQSHSAHALAFFSLFFFPLLPASLALSSLGSAFMSPAQPEECNMWDQTVWKWEVTCPSVS